MGGAGFRADASAPARAYDRNAYLLHETSRVQPVLLASPRIIA
jgi:hypothetical protein